MLSNWYGYTSSHCQLNSITNYTGRNEALEILSFCVIESIIIIIIIEWLRGSRYAETVMPKTENSPAASCAKELLFAREGERAVDSKLHAQRKILRNCTSRTHLVLKDF